MRNIILLLGVLALGGCGVKPGSVEPPPGGENAFPRTYPDTATDPQ